MKKDNVKLSSMQDLGPILETVLQGSSQVKLRITGNSMYPLLRSGRDDVILTRHTTLKKGDIIFYQRQDGSYVLHRIVGKKDGAFYLAGDAQMYREYPIYPTQVIGVVTEVYSRGKRISCKNPLYLIYSHLWTFLLPKRRSVLKIYHRIRAGIGSWGRL